MNKLAVFEVNQELRLVKLIGIVNCQEQKKYFSAHTLFFNFHLSRTIHIFMQLGFSSNGTSFGRLTNSLVA